MRHFKFFKTKRACCLVFLCGSGLPRQQMDCFPRSGWGFSIERNCSMTIIEISCPLHYNWTERRVHSPTSFFALVIRLYSVRCSLPSTNRVAIIPMLETNALSPLFLTRSFGEVSVLRGYWTACSIFNDTSLHPALASQILESNHWDFERAIQSVSSSQWWSPWIGLRAIPLRSSKHSEADRLNWFFNRTGGLSSLRISKANLPLLLQRGHPRRLLYSFHVYPSSLVVAVVVVVDDDDDVVIIINDVGNGECVCVYVLRYWSSCSCCSYGVWLLEVWNWK